MSDIKKVVLAYSGGLDTSVIVKWLQESYQCEVVTFTADLGQGEEVEPARAKAQAKDRRRKFVLDLALPISIGLEEGNIARLLGNAGFRVQKARPLPEGQFGPPRPDQWEWRPARRKQERQKPAQPREGNAFAALADLVR